MGEPQLESYRLWTSMDHGIRRPSTAICTFTAAHLASTTPQPSSSPSDHHVRLLVWQKKSLKRHHSYDRRRSGYPNIPRHHAPSCINVSIMPSQDDTLSSYSLQQESSSISDHDAVGITTPDSCIPGVADDEAIETNGDYTGVTETAFPSNTQQTQSTNRELGPSKDGGCQSPLYDILEADDNPTSDSDSDEGYSNGEPSAFSYLMDRARHPITAKFTGEPKNGLPLLPRSRELAGRCRARVWCTPRMRKRPKVERLRDAS
jgi:hypothetical protein